MTGSAEMESAVPKKNAKIRRSEPGSAPRNRGNNPAAAKPSANGKSTPKELTKSALLPCRKTFVRSTSMPAVSRNSTTPMVATASMTIDKAPVSGKTVR